MRKLFILIIIAIILRFSFLSFLPFIISGDAARFAIDGINIIKNKGPIFATGWYGHTNLLFYIYGFFQKIFNDDLLAIRSFSALGGILGIISTFFFVKTIFNEEIAIISAFILNFSFFNLIFSRIGTETIWMTFFAPLILMFIYKKNLFFNFLSGLFLGLSQYFYPGSKLLFIIIPLLILSQIIFKEKKIVYSLISLLFLTIGFFISYGPMIIFYLKNPNYYWERVNIVSIFHSGWLNQQLKKNSLLNIFFNQIKNSFLVFIFPIKEGACFWVYYRPWLDYISSLFFLIGFLYSLINIKQLSNLLIIFYFIIGVFFAGVFTIDSPVESRYTIIFPVITTFIAIGIKLFLEIFKKRKNLFKKIILITIFVINLIIYYKHETFIIYNFDINTQIATYAGLYLKNKKINNSYKIYFLGNENMYYKAIPTLFFLTKKDGIDINKNLEVVDTQHNKNNIFIILPYRKKDLIVLKKMFLKGKITEFRNPLKQTLFYIYEN